MGPSSFETPWRAARGANEATEGGVSFSQTWALIAQRAALMETAISRRRAATTLSRTVKNSPRRLTRAWLAGRGARGRPWTCAAGIDAESVVDGRRGRANTPAGGSAPGATARRAM